MRPVSHARRPRTFASTLAPVCSSLALVALSGGCGWVDSTGRQSDDAAPITVLLDQVAPGEALVLNEGRSARLDLERVARLGDAYSWSETPTAQGALDSCADVPGFRPELAAATLEEACATAAGSCAFDFVRDPPPASDLATGGPAPDENVAFVVVAPTLRASVGLRHELTLTTADGASGSSGYDFCLVAINEAPTAVDDGPYVVTEGTTLVIGADDPANLLANDTDDDDVGNADALRVSTTPVRAPSASGTFALRADGGFEYSFPDMGIRDSIVDSFEYVISDGVFASEPATVSLTIVPSDLPPALALPFEPIEASVGQALAIDLAAGFSDPEGVALRFAAIPDTLPASGSLTIDGTGRLTGVPLAADIGTYDVRLIASDGVRETEARLALTVVAAPNEAPRYRPGSIADIVLLRARPMEPRTAVFEDPDGDPLVYELVGDLPAGLSFDTSTGTLSGRPVLLGNFTGLQILAIDPAGAVGGSIVFSIQVVGRLG